MDDSAWFAVLMFKPIRRWACPTINVLRTEQQTLTTPPWLATDLCSFQRFATSYTYGESFT
jgi:hypothetical protein